jgi:O-antigen/teichoic acid export membrane protein
MANFGGITNPAWHLLRRGSLYTITLAVQLSATVLVVPVVTREMSPEGFGSLALALVVMQILTLVASAGLPAAITRFYFNGHEGSVGSRSLVALSAGAAIVVAGFADVSGPVWSQLFSGLSYDSTLRIATWSVVPLAVVLSCQAVLRAEDRAGAFIAVGGVAAIGAQLLALIALMTIEANPVYYLAGLGLGTLLASFVGVAAVSPLIPRSPIRLLRAALRYGVPTIPHGLALFLLAAGDRIVIERLLGLADVGRYQVAYLVGAVGIALAAAFNNAWAPMIYASSDSDRPRLLARTSSVAFRLACLSAGLISLAAPLGLWIFAPAEYSTLELTPVSAIVGLSVIPYVAYLAGVHVVFHHGKTSVVAWLTPLSALINVLLNYLLIPPLGLTGAAFATLVSYCLLALGVHAMSSTLESVRWPFAEQSGWVALAMAMALLGSFLPSSGSGGWWLRGVLCLAIAAELGRVLRRFRANA